MPPKPTPGGAAAAFAERQQAKQSLASSYLANVLANRKSELNIDADSPMRLGAELKAQPSLLEQVMPEEEWGVTDMSFDEIEVENQLLPSSSPPLAPVKFFGVQKGAVRGVLGDKENLVPSV
jgi:centromeric protein E